MEGQNWQKYHDSIKESGPEGSRKPYKSLRLFSEVSKQIPILQTNIPLRILVLGTLGKDSTAEYLSVINSLGRGRAWLENRDNITFADLYRGPLQDSKMVFKAQWYDYVQLNGLGLPFQNGSFDLVLSDILINYFCDEKLLLLLQECSRVLQPEGVQMHAAIYHWFQITQGIFDFLVGNLRNRLLFGVRFYCRTLRDYKDILRKAQLPPRAEAHNKYTSTVVYAV